MGLARTQNRKDVRAETARTARARLTVDVKICISALEQNTAFAKGEQHAI
jgi:hypothetical protein